MEKQMKTKTANDEEEEGKTHVPKQIIWNFS